MQSVKDDNDEAISRESLVRAVWTDFSPFGFMVFVFQVWFSKNILRISLTLFIHREKQNKKGTKTNIQDTLEKSEPCSVLWRMNWRRYNHVAAET